MRICDAGENPVGTVTGTLNLHSRDPRLRAAWEAAEKNIPESLSDVEERRKQYLTGQGYRVT